MATSLTPTTVFWADSSSPLPNGLPCKAAGVLSADQSIATKSFEAGANFVAIGVDATLLVRTAKDLLAIFNANINKEAASTAPSGAY